MGSILRRSALLLVAALGVTVLLVANGTLVVPPRYDPWAPLDLREAPGLLTRFKLGRLEGDGPQCRAALGGSALRFTPVPDRAGPGGCGLTDALRVAGSGVAFSSAFTAACPLAAAWTLFEGHALQPAAERHFGRRVARVEHLGTYACRNVYGRSRGRLSEHATANAIDVAAFVLTDGTRVVLSADWGQGGSAKAAFLRDVRDGACQFFDAVLGPDYNAAHRDHFHFDMGAFRVCR